MRPRSQLHAALERPHLDGQRDDACDSARPGQRLVEVGGVDDVDPADVLLPLEVRTVGDEYVSFPHPDDGRGGRRVQSRGEHPDAGGPHLVVERGEVAHHPLEYLGWGRAAIGLIDAEQVLSHVVRTSLLVTVPSERLYVAIRTPVPVGCALTRRSGATACRRRTAGGRRQG
jgi:hypothetical protein